MRRLLSWTAMMALAVAGCAGPGATATPPVDQGQAVAEVQKLGGKVTVDENAPGKPVTAVNLSDVAITDASLACLAGFPHLQALDLGHTKKLGKSTITDGGLAHVEKLTELRHLSLTSTDINDAGLVHLKGLTHLESLNLEQTKVSDAGLKNLAGLTKLQRLKLMGTKVTDTGVKSLQESLPGCKISL